jgi:hypothetical protein
MTFSLFYEDSPEEICALDWDWNWDGQTKNIWTRSEKSSIKWVPYKRLNEAAYNGLLVAFGLEDKKEKLTLDQIVKMSPAELSKMGTKNPQSVTLGDHRCASEVSASEEVA